MLEINVQKKLGEISFEANLTIPSQGVTVIFGLSGSGKTTLINLVSGLIQPDRGYIRLNGKTLVDTAKNVNLSPNLREIGYVFQESRLFPHYRAEGNLRYGMKKKDKKAFDHIVKLLGIEHLLRRYPMTLSGGERQRVAIGRALLTFPQLLLMDEPLAALDLPRKRELLDYLEKLANEISIPILYVTHSLDELQRLAKNVVLLEQGKVKTYESKENLLASSLFLPWKEYKK